MNRVRKVRLHRSRTNGNTVWIYVQFSGRGYKGSEFNHIDTVPLPDYAVGLIASSMIMGFPDVRTTDRPGVIYEFDVTNDFFKQFKEQP